MLVLASRNPHRARELVARNEDARGRDRGVARDPPEVTFDAFADRDPRQHPLRPRPPAERFRKLRADPRDRASHREARRQAQARKAAAGTVPNVPACMMVRTGTRIRSLAPLTLRKIATS